MVREQPHVHPSATADPGWIQLQNAFAPREHMPPHTDAGADLAALQLDQFQGGDDPLAPVYIVTSRDTWQGIRGLARDAVARRDSTGMPLVISETRADRLGEIGRYVHVSERRCGGYFAFPSRAQAEAFVRADRSRQAMAKSLLAGYTLDNQATVNRWLPQVQERRIYDTINHLSSYRNRYYASSFGRTSAEWIRTHWQSLAAGSSHVTTELFTACTNCSTQPSVILTIKGWDLPNEVVVLGAHLDSINANNRGDLNQLAPGADDDASGIATLTETLRIALSGGWRPRRTVKFMGYAAEEVGLRGSNAIAQSFRSSGVNVVAVLQVDMTNYKSGAVPDMKLITDYSNTDLKSFSVTLFDTYLAPWVSRAAAHLRLRLLRPRLVDERRLSRRDDVRGRRPERWLPLHPHHQRHAGDDGRIRAEQCQVRTVRTGLPRRNRQDRGRQAGRLRTAAGAAALSAIGATP